MCIKLECFKDLLDLKDSKDIEDIVTVLNLLSLEELEDLQEQVEDNIQEAFEKENNRKQNVQDFLENSKKDYQKTFGKQIKEKAPLDFVDIYLKDTDKYIIEIVAPGRNMKDFEIYSNDNIIYIKIGKAIKNIVEYAEVIQKNIFRDGFTFTYDLTESKVKDLISTYKNGMLTIEVFLEGKEKIKTTWI